MKYDTAILLGEGAMGEVYRSFDATLGRPVALKFLHRTNPAMVERFLREARLQARVEHPHVCRVYETGERDGRPYISMQYIEGRTLDLAAQDMRIEEKVGVMRDVAEAVHAAHRTGLVHRDLKPGNIMVERREDGGWHPYVLDFGLAREADASTGTETGAVLGTPAYMAPEQARGEVRHLDRRTDVYALGAVLYHLLAGRPPFDGRNPIETVLRVLNEDPVPPRKADARVPVDLEAVALKCLEKDPSRRYESARALAEDLQRFLDGEPVLARAPGRAARLLRRARRHRVALAAAAIGMAAMSVLLGLWLRARWSSAEQARLAQRFGQEVERIEGAMREAYLLPLHDTRPEKARMRERMKHIEAEMVRLGRASFGAGHSALGRGHRTLGDRDRARHHLERAWELGQHGPETARALGRTLGDFYSEALAETHALTGDERQRRRQEIEKSLRDPALVYLRAAQTREDSLAHTEALIAYYEERHDDALRHLQGAPTEGPEAFETRLLEGHVHMATGQARARQGDSVGALASYERAGTALRTALHIARSSPEAHIAECELSAHVIEVHMEAGHALSGLEQALQPCIAAAQADPERGGPHVLRSRILWRWAEHLEGRGQKAPQQVATAIEAAREALRLDARDPHTFSNLGLALWSRGEEAVKTGRDPRPDLREAAEALERAIKLRPDWVNALVNLCGVFNALGDWEAARGLDAEPVLQRAVEAGRRAVEVGGERYWQASSNLGVTFWSRAHARLQRGVDPTPEVEEARVSFARALALNPKGAFALRGLAGVESVAAQQELWRGRDPRPALQRMLDSARRALEARPDYANAAASMGLAHAMEAEYLVEQGTDPRVALRAGRQALSQALRINADSADALWGVRRLELAAARWALRSGAPAEPALQAAAQAVQRLGRSDARNPEFLLGAAELHQVRAQWLATRGRDAAAEMKSGLAAADRMLALNPRSAQATAMKGSLLLLAASQKTAEPARSAAAREAAALLEETMRLNPLLQRQYETELSQARALAAGTNGTAHAGTSPPRGVGRLAARLRRVTAND